MRHVTSDTLTQTFLDYISDDTDERLRFILTKLAHHLHDFVRETDLTHDEWRKGCLLYTSPSPRDRQKSRMPSSA